jgi:hypothetical protein
MARVHTSGAAGEARLQKRRIIRAVRHQAMHCEGHAARAAELQAENANPLAISLHLEHAEKHAANAMRLVAGFVETQAQITGQGSAGKCPGEDAPKTPATQKRECHVVAAGMDAGDTFSRATAHAAREGIA